MRNQHPLTQSTSKHGRRTLSSYIARDGRTSMQRAALGESGSKTASQLQGRTTRVFSSNSLGKTMKIAAVIQYILTATQSLRLSELL